MRLYRGNTSYDSLEAFIMGAKFRADSAKYAVVKVDEPKLLTTMLEMATEDNRDELLEISREVSRSNRAQDHMIEAFEDLAEWIEAIKALACQKEAETPTEATP